MFLIVTFDNCYITSRLINGRVSCLKMASDLETIAPVFFDEGIFDEMAYWRVSDLGTFLWTD